MLPGRAPPGIMWQAMQLPFLRSYATSLPFAIASALAIPLDRMLQQSRITDNSPPVGCLIVMLFLLQVPSPRVIARGHGYMLRIAMVAFRGPKLTYPGRQKPYPYGGNLIPNPAGKSIHRRLIRGYPLATCGYLICFEPLIMWAVRPNVRSGQLMLGDIRCWLVTSLWPRYCCRSVCRAHPRSKIARPGIRAAARRP